MLSLEPAIPVAERLTVVQEDLAEALHQLGGEMSWTPAEHMRLNLRIVENPDGDWLLRLREQLRQIARSRGPVAWSLQGLSWAPDASTPRLLCAQVPDMTEGLASLQRQIDTLCEALGAASARNDWHPALALGRLQIPAQAPRLDGLLDRWERSIWGRTLSRELVLTASELQGSTVRWKVIDRVVLAGR
jgi:2'-5' RNA ligase